MNLKTILAKKPSELSDAEKSFLHTNWAKLNDAEKVKFVDVAPDANEGDDEEDDEELDEKGVTALIQKSVSEAINEKMESVSDSIVSKFFASAKNLSKVADGGNADGNDENGKIDKQQLTRDFMKALLAKDTAKLKALTLNNDGTDPNPDDAAAGILVPTVISSEVIRIAETQYGLARRDMLYLPFSGAGNTRTVPALGTSVTVYWTEEGQKKKSTQPKFSLVTQTLKKLAAIVPMTEEIIEDSAIDLLKLVTELLAEAIAKEEDVQFFDGTGAPWTGILRQSSSVVNEVTMTGVAATAVSVEWLQAMIDATPSGALAGAKFYMHRTVLSKIRLLREDGATGAFIFAPASQGQPQQILGYPVETSDAFPTLASISSGERFVLFGNLKQGAVFGDKQQMRVKLLDQATITDVDDESIINLAEQDMIALRVVERVGYAIGLGTALTVLEAGA